MINHFIAEYTQDQWIVLYAAIIVATFYITCRAMILTDMIILTIILAIPTYFIAVHFLGPMNDYTAPLGTLDYSGEGYAVLSVLPGALLSIIISTIWIIKEKIKYYKIRKERKKGKK